MFSVLLIFIYLAFISLGLPDSLLGAAWPVVHDDLHVPLAYMGILTMIVSFGTIVSSLFSDRLTHRFQTFRVVLVSVALTALALFGFSFSTRFWQLCLFAVPYGLGAGAIDSALNNYVALHYSSRQMSWLHCFWRIGTLLSPYMMSYALSLGGNWHLGYRIVAFIQSGIAIVFLFSLPLWKRCDSQKRTEEETRCLSFKEKFRIRHVVFVLIGFLAYCAFEATLMSWTSTYLVEVRLIDEVNAAAFASLFFIGITGGRFLSGLFGNRLSDQTMIRIGSLIILISLILIVLPVKSDVLCLIGFVTIGIGCAPIYPSVIHSTPTHFGREYAQAIIGLQMAFAYIGSSLMPPLFGVLASWISVEILPLFILFFLILMVAMLEILNRKVARDRQAV